MTNRDKGGGDGPARLVALEMRIAHQDGVLADLDAVVTAQWAEIDRLKRQIAALVERVGEAEAKMDAALPQKRPPHY